jgi:hypothetical protein
MHRCFNLTIRSPRRPLGEGASTRFLYEGAACGARLTRGVISGFGSCLLGIPPPIALPGPMTPLLLTELELLASQAFYQQRSGEERRRGGNGRKVKSHTASSSSSYSSTSSSASSSDPSMTSTAIFGFANGSPRCPMNDFVTCNVSLSS